MGARVLDYLRTAGMPVVVIDTVARPDDPRLHGARLVKGDCRQRETLEQAGIADARGVLILTNDDLLNLSTALMVRSLNKDVRIVLRMFNQNLLARMGQTVRNVFALSTSLLTAPLLATAALTGQALGTFRVTDSPNGLRQLVEIHVGPGSPLLGQSAASVTIGRDLLLLGHLPESSDPRLLLDIDPNARLAAGDRLILCGQPASLAPLLATGEEESLQVRWAGWLRSAWRIVRQTFAQIDTAVLICTTVLVLTLAASTITLSLGVEKYRRPQDAFLRTVSIMATGAPLQDEDYRDNVAIRVFVPTLRLVGTLLLAAFTAIVTNYLIRARLGAVLEARRVPEGGHVIVCGLSTVGFRVTEELIKLGERVVVIEQEESNRFVPTARRLGAAVMIGDGSVLEVLRQANAQAAKAIVSATNNDMTNLEVCLLARELNPEQRVVPLVNDPQFARMLREAADIRLAVSVPALAAPASVAGLFGDRVLNVFLIGDRLFAALDLVIHPGDPFIGQPLRAVAVDYGFLPVAHIHPSGPPTGLAARLAPEERVVCLIALSGLERLLGREPVPHPFTVEVTACPIPTLPWLAGLLRTRNGLTAEEAERAAATLPLVVGTRLSRGQAEDLLAQLARERVTAILVGV
jgi:Trk K+ transport system NAD-binding subunit